MKAVYGYDLPWAFGAAPTDKVRHMQAPFDMREYTKDGVELMYEILNMQGLKVAGRNFQTFFNNRDALFKPAQGLSKVCSVQSFNYLRTTDT